MLQAGIILGWVHGCVLGKKCFKISYDILYSRVGGLRSISTHTFVPGSLRYPVALKLANC